jgi:hypothetical protein
MPRKAVKPNDPAEYKRFLETAKKVEADDRPEAFDRAFKKVVAPKKSVPQRKS